MQAAISREQLLDAAEEIFSRKGFRGATLKEVADSAEFAVGSVYSFFASKEELFRAVFIRRGAEFMALLADVVARPSSPVTVLHDLVDMEIGYFHEHPAFGRLVFRYSNALSLPFRDDTILSNAERATQLQAQVFSRGQKARFFHKGDPYVLSRLLSGLISAYETVDPVVMSERPAPSALSLSAFHDLIDRTFVIAAS
jgi:TetR/AcrR family transcriptional regulator